MNKLRLVQEVQAATMQKEAERPLKEADELHRHQNVVEDVPKVETTEVPLSNGGVIDPIRNIGYPKFCKNGKTYSEDVEYTDISFEYVQRMVIHFPTVKK